MYEHLRNDFQTAAAGSGMRPQAIGEVLNILDGLVTGYEISKKETSLAVLNDELPEIVKVYVVCKKVEGLAQPTLDAYLRTLRLFFRTVRKAPTQVTANDIRVYLYKYQQERGCTNRSLDKYRQYLAGFFGWAVDEGYIPTNPMRTIAAIKYEKKQRQHLTQLELEYLRSCCRTLREKAIIEVLFSTGCRVSELVGLKRSDIDWNTRSVHLFGKGSKHRTSYLNARAEVSLKAYLKGRSDDSEFLFVTERRPYRSLTTNSMEKAVGVIASRAPEGMTVHITPHVLRHTTATLALQNGMPIADISRLLGMRKWKRQ